jgi:hypothetical protein
MNPTTDSPSLFVDLATGKSIKNDEPPMIYSIERIKN